MVNLSFARKLHRVWRKWVCNATQQSSAANQVTNGEKKKKSNLYIAFTHLPKIKHNRELLANILSLGFHLRKLSITNKQPKRTRETICYVWIPGSNLEVSSLDTPECRTNNGPVTQDSWRIGETCVWAPFLYSARLALPFFKSQNAKWMCIPGVAVCRSNQKGLSPAGRKRASTAKKKE